MSIIFEKLSRRAAYMSISDRQQQILNLLEDNTFLSVEQLSRLLYTSSSSIRRDLTKLQSMNYVKRTHGGATVAANDGILSLEARMTTNIAAKKLIAKKASSLIRDNQTIMLDNSTTASFLIPYIARKSGITLFTNNLNTAMSAIKNNINTYCLGGNSLNGSAALVGAYALSAAETIYPDIFFFSSNALNRDGIITDPTSEENHLRSVILKNSKTKVFLCDSSKLDRTCLYRLTSLNDIDYAVFDTEIKIKCKCDVL